MKLKSLFLAVLLSCGFLLANAQVVEKGDKVVNLGLGLGSALYSGVGYKGSVPPLSGSLEVVIKDDLFEGKGALGVGGYLGYSAYKWEYSGWGWKYSNIIIGPRGYLHYNLIDKLDTYVGAMLGYNIATSKEFGNSIPGYDYSASSGGVIFSGFVGARYFFNDKVAGMVELGSGIAYLNIGVALKL
ncbi:MAG: hypothetical protein JZU47_03270 [Prolixibacteraceae bacterium]|jgi:hypothetical protein|nr:hypothetical protein [Prolixibacteraceae bacterium]